MAHGGQVSMPLGTTPQRRSNSSRWSQSKSRACRECRADGWRLDFQCPQSIDLRTSLPFLAHSFSHFAVAFKFKLIWVTKNGIWRVRTFWPSYGNIGWWKNKQWVNTRIIMSQRYTWLCKKVGARLREKFSPSTARPGQERPYSEFTNAFKRQYSK